MEMISGASSCTETIVPAYSGETLLDLASVALQPCGCLLVHHKSLFVGGTLSDLMSFGLQQW